MNESEKEMELVVHLQFLWRKRQLVLKIMVAFMIFGLIVAFGSREEFVSDVELLPEGRQTSSLGGISSLARQFGVSTGSSEPSDGIPARLYPDIAQSLVLARDLMDFKVTTPVQADSITLFDYFRNYHQPTFVDYLRKYTIRLPFTIVNWFVNLFPSDTNTEVSSGSVGGAETELNRLINLNSQEWSVVRTLRSRITAELDDMTGVVTISVKMPHAHMSGEVAHQVVDLLSQYVVDYRTEKAKQSLTQIEEQLEEYEDRFEEDQINLANFYDSNRGQLTNVARTEEAHFQNQYDLSFNLYSTMRARREEARIRLQEETPVVNVVKPAVVPDRPSEPDEKRIFSIYTIFGIFVSLGVVFSLKYWPEFKHKMTGL